MQSLRKNPKDVAKKGGVVKPLDFSAKIGDDVATKNNPDPCPTSQGEAAAEADPNQEERAMSITTPKPTAEQLSLAADLLHYAAKRNIDAKCVDRLRLEIAREDADGVADEIASLKAALGWFCGANGCTEELDYDTRDGKPLALYCSRQCAQSDPDFWGGL